MIERLNFSTNWNKKLDCDIFSTIRIWNQDKHFQGKEVDIYDNSIKPARYKGRAKYEIVSEFKLSQLKASAAMLDTGYTLSETINILRTMYYKKVPDIEKQSFAYIILRKIKTVEKQNTLEL
jgi:hypothetical protein